MSYEPLTITKNSKSVSQQRIAKAKRSFVTRRMDLEEAAILAPNMVPIAGDLCLARLVRKGHHQRIELPDGRRARMYDGDEVILAYGNRYATDQFHAVVPQTAGRAQLAAAGGIAATVLARHQSTKRPTEIEVLGTLCRKDGTPLNLADRAVKIDPNVNTAKPHVIAVFGSGMNAGKTTSVCDLVRALARANVRANVVKVTGTGAGGDIWQYEDSGAGVALDFTDAGHASTMGLSLAELEQINDHLLAAASKDCDCIVVEIADGLLQRETTMLLQSARFKETIDSLILATPDPLSALGGQAYLDKLGYDIAAFVGRISTSPLFVKELEDASSTPVLTSQVLAQDERAIGVFLQRTVRTTPQLAVNNA